MADEVRPPAARVTNAQYSTAVAVLGLVCFALSVTTLALPLWGYYSSTRVGPETESGYFGPWHICKYLLYDRKKCGVEAARFKPAGAVKLAGVAASGSTGMLALFCLLSILQLAMVVSRDRVLLPYSFVVLAKLVLSLLSSLLSIVAASLFALQTDDKEKDFKVTRGESFYIEVVLIILSFLVFILSMYDMIFSRRLGGDPTVSSRDPSGHNATTFNNPHFKERKGIAMTDASGRPYPSTNGSSGSNATLFTTLSSNGSTSGSISGVRSPLRSSLKKPRNGLGIQNPGYSGSSPTPSRNGSVKRVRIQTNSTPV